MWLERDIDCLMTRTKNRPLPQQRLAPSTALVFGALQGALALPVARGRRHHPRRARPPRPHPLRRRVHADEAALALGRLGRQRARRDARAHGLDRRNRSHRSRRPRRVRACCSSGRSRTPTRSRSIASASTTRPASRRCPARTASPRAPRRSSRSSSSRSRSASRRALLGVAGLPYLVTAARSA